MCEFNPEIPKLRLDTQQSAAKDNEYSYGMKKIEQLESELQKKEKALAVKLKEQVVLSETLKACINTFQTVTGQMNKMESELESIAHHYRLAIGHIEKLEQENKRLVLSNSAWSSRSIKLEFEILKANEERKSIKQDHDLAFDIIDLLLELKTQKTETDSIQQQSHNDDDQRVN